MAIHIIGKGKYNLTLIELLLVLVCSNCISCNFGAGIFYPKYVYDFELQNNTNFMTLGDGEGAYGVLKKADETQSEIDFYFSQTGNSFKSYMNLYFLTKKAYSIFLLIELKLEWDNMEKIFIKNSYFKMPEIIYTCDMNEESFNSPFYLTNGKYYWTQSCFLKPLDENNNFPLVNQELLFKNHKKIGEEFPCKIIMKYRFDEDQIKELVLEYKVKVIKNWYVSSFAGR